jgi:hypothetical protein
MFATRKMQDRCANAIMFLLVLFLLATPVVAQQTDVTRFDAFAGYAYLNSPAVSLPEHGVQLQVAVRPKTWVSLGFDFSVATGDLTITPNLLLDSLQQSLGGQLKALAAAGQLPAGYSLTVPAHSQTQTYAAGPQFALRRWKPITLFLRPSIGIMRETATPRPGDPIAKAIVAQLAPTGEKKDRVIFYGFGGGVDFNLSHHLAFRVQADLVRDHLFDDLLKNSRGTVRFSFGPAFNFGKNIVE